MLGPARSWLSALTDHASEGVVLLDEHQRVAFASPSIERMIGFDPSGLDRGAWLDLALAADRASVAAAFDRVMAQPGEPAVVECRARDRDGRPVSLLVTARNLLADPDVRSVVANVRDVTRERHIAAELSASEHRVHEVLDALPVMIYSVEAFPPFKPIYVSRGHSTLGFSHEEWMQPGLWERQLHPEDRERVLRDIAAAQDKHEPLVTEYRVLDKQGRVRSLVDRGRFTFDAQGRPATWHAVLTDVTPRREAERAIRESEERYRELFNEDVAANYVSTPEGKLLACNAQFVRLLGFESGEALRRMDMTSIYDTPADRDNWLRLFERDGKVSMLENRLRRADGTYAHVLENARARRDEHGRIVEIHGHLIDVSEQRRLEAQLRQAQKLEAVGRLAGGIAHDFNNLLAIIGNYSSVLRAAAPEGSTLQADLGEIERAVDRGASLTRQILTFSRERLPDVTEVDVDSAIRDADRMLRRLLGPEVALEFDLDAAGALVRMDRGHIDQILVNLLLNASDAMPAGGTVRVATMLASLPAGADSVRITVRDEGEGMDPETARRAAEPFFTTKSMGRGTGLGLSSVYGIVKELGGDFAIESKLGAGTAVVIHLPLVPGARAGAPAEDAPAAAAHGARAAARVLLVDDEPAMLKSLGLILTRHAGLHVTTASSGTDALAQWDRNAGRFDLVVTDVRMPEMGGEALIRGLRERGATVGVLVMSGYPEDQFGLADLFNENVRFIAKPYSLAEMVAAVRGLLQPS